MANPLVRPSLSFYPEEAGVYMDSMRHGERWRQANPQLACPMARRKLSSLVQDFYVYEPALARLNPSTFAAVVPFRWFNIRGQDGLFAEVRELHYDEDKGEYLILPRSSTIPLENFVLSYPEIVKDHSRYLKFFPVVPNKIHGMNLNVVDVRTAHLMILIYSYQHLQFQNNAKTAHVALNIAVLSVVPGMSRQRTHGDRWPQDESVGVSPSLATAMIPPGTRQRSGES
jgi:hypothetical protein